MTRFRSLECLKGIWSTSIYYTVCVCIHAGLGKDKSQRVSRVLSRDNPRLIWFRLGSHHSSGKALFVGLRRGQNGLQSEAKHRNTSNLADRCAHRFIRIPVGAHTWSFFPYIEYNKYVSVFGGQSNSTSSVIWELIVLEAAHTVSVYQVWGSAGYCTGRLLSLNPSYGLLNVAPVYSHAHISSSHRSLVWLSTRNKSERNRRHVAAMWYGSVVGPVENVWLISVFFPASGWTSCQSSRTQAEISWPGASTSKEEADSREPGCTYSLYSAPTDLQGQNKADKIRRAVWLPHGHVDRAVGSHLVERQTLLNLISLHFHFSF